MSDWMIRTATRLWLIWHWLLCTDVRTGLECAHFPLVVRLTNALGEEVYRAERAEAELARVHDIKVRLTKACFLTDEVRTQAEQLPGWSEWSAAYNDLFTQEKNE